MLKKSCLLPKIFKSPIYQRHLAFKAGESVRKPALMLSYRMQRHGVSKLQNIVRSTLQETRNSLLN